MKTYLLILMLCITAATLSYSRSSQVTNFKVTKAVLDAPIYLQDAKNVTVLRLRTWVTCPNNSRVCKTGGIQTCDAIESSCDDPPQQPYKSFVCPGSSYPNGCGASGTGTGCSVIVTCGPGGPGDPPTTTAIPCTYGTIAFGCFAIVGGPACGTLVNCQTPPDFTEE